MQAKSNSVRMPPWSVLAMNWRALARASSVDSGKAGFGDADMGKGELGRGEFRCLHSAEEVGSCYFEGSLGYAVGSFGDAIGSQDADGHNLDACRQLPFPCCDQGCGPYADEGVKDGGGLVVVQEPGDEGPREPFLVFHPTKAGGCTVALIGYVLARQVRIESQAAAEPLL